MEWRQGRGGESHGMATRTRRSQVTAPRTSLRAAHCCLAIFLRTDPCMSSAEALGSWEAFTRRFAVLRSEPAPSVPSSASAW